MHKTAYIIVIKGVGTDIIEVERMQKRLNEDPGFIKSIFTEHEIDYCESQKFKAQNFAARFAAKEAFFKALGTGWRNGMTFREIEVKNDELGKPFIVLNGKAKEYFDKQALNHIHVSLSHTQQYALAMVLIEN